MNPVWFALAAAFAGAFVAIYAGTTASRKGKK